MPVKVQPIKINRDSSTRWQGRTIEQFGYALNLILGLSVAVLGYELSHLLDEKFKMTSWQHCLLIISTLTLLLSITGGLWCVVNRLRNFRATAVIARMREDGASDMDLQSLRGQTDALGKRAWQLLWWQIVTFGMGLLLLVIAIGGKIFMVRVP